VIDALHKLADDERDAVFAVVQAARVADGVAPLSERGMLRLRAVASATHLVARSGDQLIGYAQLDQDTGAAELVVHPAHRRRGVGRTLLHELIVRTSGSALRVWAHGDLDAARALAAATGLRRVRSLWQMARPLTDGLPVPRLPEGVTVGTFVPGADDEAWLALNARVFASHPEQGSWTLSDLRARMAEPWFDPAGFFLARRSSSMIGFHWTKVHDESIGEVYVVGIDPAERGRGLGKALTLIGLHHLRDNGRRRVILYVDDSNRSAVELYRGLGFEQIAADVMYAGPDVE
jgi:mycothiol synthase